MIVYKITHRISGKCYIGKTKNTLPERMRHHYSPRSSCVALRNALQKHGKEDFSVSIIGTYDNTEDMDNAEEYFIQWHNSVSPNGYNLRDGGGSSAKFSNESRAKMSESGKRRAPISEVTREKLRIARSGENGYWFGKKMPPEMIAKLSSSHKGKPSSRKGIPHTPEAKAKMSASQKGRGCPMKGKLHSEGSKKKMSQSHRGVPLSETHRKSIGLANKGRKDSEEILATKRVSQKTMTPILCLNNNTVYFSQCEAARKLNLESKNINRVLKGRRKSVGGYKFIYLEKKKG